MTEWAAELFNRYGYEGSTDPIEVPMQEFLWLAGAFALATGQPMRKPMIFGRELRLQT